MTNSIQCPGFQAAGIAAGIKKNSDPDMGLILTQHPAVAAGVFTRNQVQAAPVRLTRAQLADGKARAIIVNSGNANCCTGPRGEEDALQMARLTAKGLGLAVEEVLVASTGVIGEPLPMEKIEGQAPVLAAALKPDGFEDFASAIMTTDTVPKLIQREGELGGHPFTLVAAAKGAGMIRPDMATMLCFVCTDAEIAQSDLQRCLKKSVDRSLNCITIDGDTSTNDMVLVLANGNSGAKVATADEQAVFQRLLDDLLLEVARALIRDGEGVTKVVDIQVRGAESDDAAFRVANVVAHSPLVKTAFFGEDANWGRIIAAVGRSGVAIEPERIDLFFGDIAMVKEGQGCGPDAEALATEVMKQPEFALVIDLHQGEGAGCMITSDLSVEYIKINADYRS